MATHTSPSLLYETYIRAELEEVWQAFVDGELTTMYFHGTRIETNLVVCTAFRR